MPDSGTNPRRRILQTPAGHGKVSHNTHLRKEDSLMLGFLCMCALAALLLYWKIQNIKERKQRQAEEKAQQAKAAAEEKRAAKDKQ